MKRRLITEKQLVHHHHHHLVFFFEGPRNRCYGRTAALKLIVQPCDEDD
jgi:hypothetical protein